MLLFTSLEPHAGGSPPPPAIGDTVIDFVNGVYTVGATSYALSDVIDHPELVDVGGLEVPRFDPYAIRLIPPFDSVALTDAFTVVIEWENAASLDSFVVLLTVQTDDLYANPGGNAIYFFLAQSGTQEIHAQAWLDNSSVEFGQDNLLFAGGQPNDPLTTHKVATNWSGLSLVSSLDGQAVVDDPIGFPLSRSLGQTHAYVASEFSASSDGGGVTFGVVTIRKIWFYVTPVPESHLPSLSA